MFISRRDKSLCAQDEPRVSLLAPPATISPAKGQISPPFLPGWDEAHRNSMLEQNDLVTCKLRFYYTLCNITNSGRICVLKRDMCGSNINNRSYATLVYQIL